MENYTIKNQHEYFDWSNKLQYLMNYSPKTEDMIRQMQQIQEEVQKFEQLKVN